MDWLQLCTSLLGKPVEMDRFLILGKAQLNQKWDETHAKQKEGTSSVYLFSQLQVKMTGRAHPKGGAERSHLKMTPDAMKDRF